VNGGELVAEVLVRQGVRHLFTLCGGHISPILVAAHRRGIRVVDTRHEATAVFAADAVSRLTGIPGVAAVTAGPGVTNTMTAIKNAQLAQSPLVLLGGATAGLLRGRGALQDIDQLALIRPHVKRATSVKRVRDIPAAVIEAFTISQEGVPGPVFVELPVDLLYDESLVREWFGAKGAGSNRLLAWYLRRYLTTRFSGAQTVPIPSPHKTPIATPAAAQLSAAARRLAAAKRPLLLLGSQVTLDPALLPALAGAIGGLGVPTYLSGMARGLLGTNHRLQMRHRRKEALRKADLVILAGVAADFRLGYGRDIGRKTAVVSINRSATDLKKNRRPDLAVHGDPASFLIALAAAGARATAEESWANSLVESEGVREREIDLMAEETVDGLNPVALCQAIERQMSERSTIVADGGDFVATASYILRPRSPLSWLDPGPFGTLGVGAGFAIAAALCRPESESWLLYGDGALGLSLSEFDTFARHRLPVIAVVGNDGCWSQIHRDQVEILGDDTGCMLARSDYHSAAEGLGAKGLIVRDPADVSGVLSEAKRIAAEGRPVLVNAWIGRTAFRKGSISI
jgi:acetolactate synthase-like protein